MVGEFSLIVLRKGRILTSPREFFNLGKDIIEYIDGVPVSKDEFDKSFVTYNRVIVEHSKELREIHKKIMQGELDAKMVKLNKDLFIKKKDQRVRDISVSNLPDKDYGIIDIHMIDTQNGPVNVINISLNGFINNYGRPDFKIRTYMNIGLAKKLSIGISQDIISIFTDRVTKNGIVQMEFFKLFDNTIGAKSGLTTLIPGKQVTALSVYQELSGIDVGELLMTIDKNVDAQNAPKIIAEANELIEKLKKSIEFMKSSGIDKPSIDYAKTELKQIINTKRWYESVSKTNKIKMVTMPFKLKSKEKISAIINDGKKEMSGMKQDIIRMN